MPHDFSYKIKQQKKLQHNYTDNVAIPSRMHASNLLLLPTEIIQIVVDHLWPEESTALLMAVPKLANMVTDEHLAFQDRRGYTILHWALSKNAEVIFNFIARRCAQNQVTCDKGYTLLYYAIYGGHYKITKMLINAGFDLWAKDPMGRNPLHWACAFSYRHSNLAEIVQTMIDAGVDVNALDMDGFSPLWWTITNGQKDILELLLASGADPHIRTKKGTILHGAVAYQREDMVKRAVELGVDLGVLHGERKETALMLAIRRGYDKIAQILKNALFSCDSKER
jgi:ankyrin repeat protein